MRALALTLLLASTSAPALADETTGTVLAFDRFAKVLVMEDKTVWEIGDATAVPAGIKAGDRITITFTSAGDAGVTSVDALTRAD